MPKIRQYAWTLNRVEQTFRVTVYPDRNVVIDRIYHDTGEILAGPASLQTRDEAAFFLAFARSNYTVTKTYLEV